MTQISTKWVAITGAPSSGKTSVIEYLEQLGYRVAHEVARAYIRKLLLDKSIMADQRGNVTLQNKILFLKESREKNLNPEHRIFFDRGLPDSLAYFKLYHLPVADVYQYLYKYRYEKVFFLEPLPLIHDDIRIESQEITQKLDYLIYESYLECDYEPIRVPVMNIHQRVQFILDHLGESKKLSL